MIRTDTHQHLLLPERFTYPWTETFAPLQGRFGLDDYQKAAEGNDISGALFMEVDVAEDQSGDEARYFCELSEDPASGIIGVIASARPEHEGFADYLDSIAHPALKGIRRVLHVAPNEISQSQRFRENVAALPDRGLTFDLCVRADQLSLAVALVDACPATRFMLDHCGCPPLANGPEAIGHWKNGTAELALRPNVHVKLSGLVTCIPPEADALECLQPVLDHVLDHFGPSRLAWGGDWPVCDLASSLGTWCTLTDVLLTPLTDAERDLILSKTANTFYRISE